MDAKVVKLVNRLIAIGSILIYGINRNSISQPEQSNYHGDLCEA